MVPDWYVIPSMVKCRSGNDCGCCSCLNANRNHITWECGRVQRDGLKSRSYRRMSDQIAGISECQASRIERRIGFLNSLSEWQDDEGDVSSSGSSRNNLSFRQRQRGQRTLGINLGRGIGQSDYRPSKALLNQNGYGGIFGETRSNATDMSSFFKGILHEISSKI